MKCLSHSYTMKNSTAAVLKGQATLITKLQDFLTNKCSENIHTCDILKDFTDTFLLSVCTPFLFCIFLMHKRERYYTLENGLFLKWEKVSTIKVAVYGWQVPQICSFFTYLNLTALTPFDLINICSQILNATEFHMKLPGIFHFCLFTICQNQLFLILFFNC